MRTAKTYENWTRISEPYTKENGKLYTKVETNCPRCGGLGIIVSRVENGQPIPIPVDQGICYECLGNKKLRKEVRLYTDAEFETMEKANLRKAEQKAAEQERKMKEEYAGKRAKWLEENGLSEDGAWVYIGEDSYQIKDNLKACGMKFNKTILWHSPKIVKEYADKMIHIPLDQICSISAYGTGYYNGEVTQFIKKEMDSRRPASNSEFIGEVKGKLVDYKCKLTQIHGFEGAYGYTNIYTFEDECGNILVWFTSTYPQVEEGQEVLLSGTIKEYKEFRGVKQTILTRCKIKVAE